MIAWVASDFVIGNSLIDASAITSIVTRDSVVVIHTVVDSLLFSCYYLVVTMPKKAKGGSSAIAPL